MGVVYRARDSRLERSVALKFLSPQLTSDPNAKERLAREARAASGLDHPNICTIYEVDQTADGHLFVVMAHYSGENLKQRIARGRLAIGEALTIALQVARGLAAAHAANIVHRDIKPANIMLPTRGEAKILDFGLAKIGGDAQRLTRTGSTMGTLAYMSPEQVRTGRTDQRSDLWSLGVLIYEMLGGQLPFHGEHEATTLYAIVNDEPQPLAKLRPDIPDGVEDIVDSLLAKDPQDRCQSAAELVTALDSLVRGGTLQETAAVGRRTATRSLLSMPLVRRRRRRQLWIVAGAVAAVLATAGLAAWFVGLRNGPPAASVAASQQPVKNLAVLPFRNLTGDPERSYFSEGLSAVLTTQLARIAGLNVVARSETAAYRNSDLPAREIAKELGVTALVTGEIVTLGGGRLRAQANLVSPESGRIIWSGPAEGTPDEIFRWQQRIAEEIASELAIPLTSAERTRLARRPTDSPEAYDLYLRALQLFEDLGPQGPVMQVALLERAVEMDPKFVLAHAALSRALLLANGRDKDPRLTEKAVAAAKAAVGIDANEPEARLALVAALRASGLAPEAIRDLLQLVAVHPNYDAAWVELADAYADVGDAAKRETSLRQAIEVRPDYWLHWNALGAALVDAGSYDEARANFEKAAQMAPKQLAPRENLAALEIMQGNYEAAISLYEAMPNPASDATRATNLGNAYFYTGRLEEAERAFRTALRLVPKNSLFHRNLADVLMRLGRADEARPIYRRAAQLVAEQMKIATSEQLRLRHLFYLARAGECDPAMAAASIFEQSAELTATNANTLAQAYASCDQRQSALRTLKRALDLGYSAKLVRDQDEFAGLKNDPEFLAILDAAQ